MKLDYKNYILGVLFCVPFISIAQVGINTTTPQAQLDIVASNQVSPSNKDGLLIPRVDTFPAINPTATQQGMLVYLTTTVGVNTPGFYYWNNSTTTWTSISVSNPGWNLIGNSGTTSGTNFIGTTDNQAIDFRTNNVIKARITTKGQIEVFNTGESVFIGENAGLNDDLSANQNVFIGAESGRSNTTGTGNTFVGQNAGANTTNGNANVFIGRNAGNFNSTGTWNNAIGDSALQNNSTGNNNIALGRAALANNSTGASNIGIGRLTLASRSTGNFNTAVGDRAFWVNNSGNNNVSLGADTGANNTNGSNNTFIGHNSGSNNNGSSNVFLGYLSGSNETGSDKLYIDNSNTANPLIFGDFLTDVLRINGTLNINNAYNLPATSGTANQILQTDGAGNTAWVNSASLTITETDPQVSSSIANYLPKWNGTTLVDGQVFDNGTNIGVGTTTPADKVHVVGNLRIDGGKIPFLNTGNSIFIGQNAGLFDDLTNNENVYVGHDAGRNNVIGFSNTGIGKGALQNATGSINTAVGRNALNGLTTGSLNTAVGEAALLSSTTSNNNTAVGGSALRSNSTGHFNVAIGKDSGYQNNGTNNTFLGGQAGFSNTTGSRNVLIGYSSGYNETGSDKLYIDNSNTANPLIYGDFLTDVLRVNGTLNINNAYNLPTTAGTANQVLQTNGAGVTSWINPSSLAITETDPQVSSTTTNMLSKWNGTTLVDGQVFDNGTNVGVGTTTPSSKLDVIGKTTTTNLQVTTGATPGFVLQSDATGNGTWVNPSTLPITETDPQVSSTTTNMLSKWNGTTLVDGQVFDNGTNVGVGTATPSSKLDVIGKTTTTNLQVTTGANSGFVLQSDAAGNGTWVNPSTLTITETDPQVSSTTTNYLPKWNGTTLVDGQVFDNGTNVGVGTATPTTHFHIASDNSATNTTIESGSLQYPTALNILPSTHATSRRTALKLDDWHLLQDLTGTGTKDFAIYQNSTGQQRITIGTTGNIGVGINNPTEKLDVNGKTKTTNLQVTNGAINGFVLQSDATGNGTWVNPSTLSITEIDPQVSSTTTNYLPKWNGTTLVDGQVFDDGTNIGVGTTTPSSKLDVIGKTTTTNLQITTGATSGYVLQSDATGNGTWVNPSALTVTETDPQVSSTTTNYIPKWNGTTLVDGQVFDTGTRIGIGTITPTDKVHVIGNVKIDGGKLPFVNTGQSVFIGENAGLNDDLSSNVNTFIGTNAGRNNIVGTGNVALGFGASQVLITGVQNVALGNNSLKNNLVGSLNTVVGSFAGENATGSSNLFLGYTTGQFATGNANVFIGNSAGKNETGNDKLYIDNTSTTTPLIYGDFATDLLRVNGTLNVNNAYNLPTTDGTANQILQTDGAGNTTWANPAVVAEIDPQVSSTTSNFIPKWNGSTLTDGIVYDNGTSVGIGLTTPVASLDITGSISSTNSLQLRSGNTFNSTSSNQILFGYNNTSNFRHAIKTRHQSGALQGNAIDFYTWKYGTDAVGTIGTQHLLTLDGNGYVGIGTTIPSEKLDVNGKIKTTDIQVTNGATNGFVLQSDATGNGTWVNPSTLSVTETDPQVSSTTTNYIPKWNGTALVDGQVFDNGTNIGVGTVTPTDRVHVVGNVKVDGGKLPFVNTGQSVFIGENAGLADDLSANQNVFIGSEAGKTNTTGNLNAFVGFASGTANTTGNMNTGFGSNTLLANTTGINNVALGGFALRSISTASNNTAIGTGSGQLTTGQSNTLLGAFSGSNMLNASNNTFLGFEAGSNNVNGSNNVFVGYRAGASESGSNKLYIDNSNTTTPLIYGDFSTNLLRVNGTLNVNNVYSLPIADGTVNQILQTNGAGVTSWVNASTLSVTENDPQVSSTTTNFSPKWNGTTLVDGQIFDDGTNVGIGTTTPTQAKFVVNGFDTNTLANFGFLNRTTPTGITNPGTAQSYSIYASNRIASSEFNAFSDARIKNVISRTNTKSDLDALSKIQITNYKHIDTISNPNKIIKKVIAQELKEVYPNAVSTHVDFIPNVYKLSEVKNGVISVSNDFKKGDKVKLIFADKEEIVEVQSATNTQFTINSTKAGKVFVYGKQVSDFHTVDYEALSTLNISATQELLKRIEELNTRLTASENENNKLKAQVDSFEQVKSDVEMLKKMMIDTKSSAIDTASKN